MSRKCNRCVLVLLSFYSTVAAVAGGIALRVQHTALATLTPGLLGLIPLGAIVLLFVRSGSSWRATRRIANCTYLWCTLEVLAGFDTARQGSSCSYPLPSRYIDYCDTSFPSCLRSVNSSLSAALTVRLR